MNFVYLLNSCECYMCNLSFCKIAVTNIREPCQGHCRLISLLCKFSSSSQATPLLMQIVNDSQTSTLILNIFSALLEYTRIYLLVPMLWLSCNFFGFNSLSQFCNVQCDLHCFYTLSLCCAS